MGYAADSNLERDSRLVEMRQAARGKTLTGFGNAQAGTSGEAGRTLPADVARHVQLRRGQSVFVRSDEAPVDAVNISRIVRQLQSESEPVRVLYENASEFREQFGDELRGKILTIAADLDERLAAEIVAVLNQD